MPKDTYSIVLDEQTKVTLTTEVCNGSGITDTIKASNLVGVVIKNKTFIGCPRENDIDLCRGSYATIGPNTHCSSPGVSNLTVKGGFWGLHLVGDFGTLEWGQYSNYDRWFALPQSKGLSFSDDAKGEVTVWYGSVPVKPPLGVKVKVTPLPIVLAYFLWRSCVQQAQLWLNIPL